MGREGLFVNDTELAAIFKALSHPARLQIIRHLMTAERCICGEIVEILPLAQSTVSQHLKQLQSAGLIQGEIDGPRRCYCLDRAQWRAFTESTRALLATRLMETLP